jgi:hypothetical protein
LALTTVGGRNERKPMALTRRNSETAEAPALIDQSVWTDLGRERQDWVSDKIAGTEDIAGRLSRLEAKDWFSAVEALTGVVPIVMHAGPLSQLTEKDTPRALTREEAQDNILAEYVNRLESQIRQQRRQQAQAEQARALHTCAVCGGVKVGTHETDICPSCQKGAEVLAAQAHLDKTLTDGRTVADLLRERAQG